MLAAKHHARDADHQHDRPGRRRQPQPVPRPRHAVAAVDVARGDVARWVARAVAPPFDRAAARALERRRRGAPSLKAVAVAAVARLAVEAENPSSIAPRLRWTTAPRRATHLVKRPWKPEEDEALVAAVTKYGACRWSMIATHLESGRVGGGARAVEQPPVPEVKKSDFSDEDDRAILIGVAELGTRWCEIVSGGSSSAAPTTRSRMASTRCSGGRGRGTAARGAAASCAAEPLVALSKRKENARRPPPTAGDATTAAAGGGRPRRGGGQVINRREAIVAIATELERAPPAPAPAAAACLRSARCRSAPPPPRRPPSQL